MNATNDECCNTDNTYAKLEVQINDRSSSDINEEPYDTASLHKNMTAHNPTYDRLAGKEDKPSSFFLRKVLRATTIYSFAKEDVLKKVEMSRSMTKRTKWPVRPAKTGKSGHPPSLIRSFTVRMKNQWALGYP